MRLGGFNPLQIPSFNHHLLRSKIFNPVSVAIYLEVMTMRLGGPNHHLLRSKILNPVLVAIHLEVMTMRLGGLNPLQIPPINHLPRSKIFNPVLLVAIHLELMTMRLGGPLQIPSFNYLLRRKVILGGIIIYLMGLIGSLLTIYHQVTLWSRINWGITTMTELYLLSLYIYILQIPYDSFTHVQIRILLCI